MARRYVNPHRQAAAQPAALAELTDAEKQKVIDGFREALTELGALTDAAPDPRQKAQRDADRPRRGQPRHIRFEGGQVTVLNSAARQPDARRQAAINAAWDALTRGLD